MSEKEPDVSKIQGSPRRIFIEQMLRVLGWTVALGDSLFSLDTAGNNPIQNSHLEGTVYKVENYELIPTADGQEINFQMAAKSADGERDDVKSFGKWIYSGDSYTAFLHVRTSRFTRGVSVVISGSKGRIEGDYRFDRISAVVISGDGTVQRQEPHEVKVRTTNPHAGLTPQQTIDQFMQDKASGRWKLEGLDQFIRDKASRQSK